MKFGAKLACVVLCALFVGGSCGCGKAVPESPYQSVGDVILALKEAGLPVTNEIVYQEDVYKRQNPNPFLCRFWIAFRRPSVIAMQGGKDVYKRQVHGCSHTSCPGIPIPVGPCIQ